MKKIDILLLSLLSAVIIVLFIMMFYIRNEGTKCMLNPGKYFIEGLEKKNDAIISCQCNMNKPNSDTLLLTKNGMEIFNINTQHGIYRGDNLNLNISK